MHGQHARPTSTLFGPASHDQTPAPEQDGARHSRRGRLTGRLRRRILAYRSIELLSSRLPGDSSPGEECLLLVHIRKVVGQVHYRICTHCAQGVITGVALEERFRNTGLGTRALSHLRSRHPGVSWCSTLNLRATRDLLGRMRVPTTTGAGLCPHTRQPHLPRVPAAL
ncbi:GNAT family N-acetyltransferase [Streptomyces sp. NPDC006326]|uniref:GNAT family N-acetyltransferase n=1 Tax=Streptomyces sp. NPDC006326 TaxID=3156752 RepID=UPI0033A65D93